MTTKKRTGGEGSIGPRGADTWRLRYRIDGKRFTRTVHGAKAAAQRELRRLLTAGDTGTHVAPDRMTLAEWTDKWLVLLRSKVTARTAERYRELLANHVLPRIGATPIQKLTVAHIDDLYASLRLTPNGVHHVHVALKAALALAVDKGHLLTNPAAKATLPKATEPNVAQALDATELRRLLDGFRNTTMFPLISVAALTGARLGEILALRWSDLDPVTKTLRIERALEVTREHGIRFKAPKSERSKRTIAIDDSLIAVLLAEKQKHLMIAAGIPDDAGDVDLSLVKLPEGALMFPRLDGDLDLTQPRSPKSVTKGTRRRFRRLGHPKLRFHDLRVTSISLQLAAGVQPHVVAHRHGHSPVIMLRVYAKMTADADRGAAQVFGELMKGVL